MKSVLHLNYHFTLVPILVKAQRRLGWKAESVSFTRAFYGFQDDHYIETPKWVLCLVSLWRLFFHLPHILRSLAVRPMVSILIRSGYVVTSAVVAPAVPPTSSGHGWRWKLAKSQSSILEFLSFATCFAWRYNVLHFHYHSALPCNLRYIDLVLWRLLGRKVVLQYEGSDIRGQSHILPRLFANTIIVTTPDLLQWEPKAVYVPGAVDLKDFPYVGASSHEGPLVILHAPTNRPIKGTQHIIEAVKTLQGQGYSIELDIVEKVSHLEALERYKKADIVIDQVLIGWYGYVAIEAMALGKPVMVYIKNDMTKYVAESPLCQTSVNTLVDDLKALIENPERRERIGREGRAYILKHHDAYEMAKRITDLYA